MCRNYRGNIANEINMLVCVTIVTRYCAFELKSQSNHFVGVNSRILRTGILRDRQWEACG